LTEAQTAASGVSADRLEIRIRPGVTFPDWSAVTSETVGAALAASFEAFGVAERWSGLDAAEDRVRRAVLEAYARTGHAPSIAQLARATGFTPSRTRDVLLALKDRDMVVLDPEGRAITGSYPFTERDTGHRVRLGDRVLNAMCAIDALGVGAMYGKDVKIASACGYCGTAIEIETRDAGRDLGRFAPESAIVWLGVEYADGCAATSLCTVMAYFCADQHLASWRAAERTDGTGFRLSMDEGLQAGKAIFMPLLAAASADNT
jgi:hypothetical protein